jgi:hypothetical protein
VSDERADLRRDGRTAWPVPGLFQAQKSVKPVRCHRITVAGWTTQMASVQPAHRRDRRTQNRRSAVRSRWTRHGALEDAQLVPQREVLEHEGALGPDTTQEAYEDQGDHAAIIDQAGRPFNVAEADAISSDRVRRSHGAPASPGREHRVARGSGAFSTIQHIGRLRARSLSASSYR